MTAMTQLSRFLKGSRVLVTGAASGMGRALAVELGPEGITVNRICPGPIETRMTEFVPQEHKVIFARRRTAA